MKSGDIVVATYGYNTVLKRPFKFLYEFGFYTEYGCVVYRKGDRNMQDSYSFKIDQVKLATARDIKNLSYGN